MTSNVVKVTPAGLFVEALIGGSDEETFDHPRRKARGTDAASDPEPLASPGGPLAHACDQPGACKKRGTDRAYAGSWLTVTKPA